MTCVLKAKSDFCEPKARYNKKPHLVSISARSKHNSKKLIVLPYTERYEDMCVFKKTLHMDK